MRGKGAIRLVFADLFEDEVQADWMRCAAERFCGQLEKLVLPNLERVQATALRQLLDSGGGVPLPRGSGPALARVAARIGVSPDLLGWAVVIRSRLQARARDEPSVSDKHVFIERFRAWCGSSITRASGLLGTSLWGHAESMPFLMDGRRERTPAAQAAALQLLKSTGEQYHQLARHADTHGVLKDLDWWLENRTLLVGGERFFLVWNLYGRGILRPADPEGPLSLSGEWRLDRTAFGSRAPDRRVLLPNEWSLVDELNS